MYANLHTYTVDTLTLQAHIPACTLDMITQHTVLTYIAYFI